MSNQTDLEHGKFDLNGRVKVQISPVEPYRPSDQDLSEPQYFGFLADNGAWYIVQQATGAANTTLFRYIKGDSNYATNWTGRAGLSYDYFSEIF